MGFHPIPLIFFENLTSQKANLGFKEVTNMAKPNRKCFKPIVKPLTTTEMIALIQNGESQENYATWAKSAPQAVRLALAENKYELDRLSKDNDPIIVETVMKKSKRTSSKNHAICPQNRTRSKRNLIRCHNRQRHLRK